MNSDYRDLLEAFIGFDVRFLVVGGVAYMAYAEPRFTKDFDVWVDASAENASKVYAALATFGAPLGELTPDDFAQEGYFYMVGVPPVRIDVLMSVPGVRFDEAWESRAVLPMAGLDVPVISKQHLIASKLASGRPRDLLDVKELQESVSSPSVSNPEDLTTKSRTARRKGKRHS